MYTLIRDFWVEFVVVIVHCVLACHIDDKQTNDLGPRRRHEMVLMKGVWCLIAARDC